ncbi:adenylate/guanylate cyclase domain-containing protein [Candidatus Woesearchaeota archaeon]|nr:adenylate/guanylate cyclase domain-containing protein [Candidatus Woesearchaeota archaeon]MBW3021553.1 adenylate/guanylate cyclase domain-containing protein [Candidatus Woesearchaeota archaeon]
MIELVITILVAIVCAYGVVKLHSMYRKTDDLKYIVFLSVVLLVFTDTWISFYGVNVKNFFTQYRFLFTFIPLLIYFLYSYLDTKRRKEQKEKEKIKSAFKQYVMPAIIDEMLKDPSKLKLGGERKNLTILFSDIRGFTTISEQLGPEKLVELLNEYLTAMTDIILENRGVVDKFIGDAIMAFWNAPLDEPKHTIQAVQSAVLMIEGLKRCNKDWAARGFPEVKIGIGLNSGDVIVGNMGSEQRFDYTCLGDHVNLAARLESSNKFYSTEIIISENIYKQVKGHFVIRELDKVIVKGKTVPIDIYEVIPEYKHVGDWGRGIKLYREGRFKEALSIFEKLPKDGPTSMYIDRCNECIKNPPKDWDGVYIRTSK